MFWKVSRSPLLPLGVRRGSVPAVCNSQQCGVRYRCPCSVILPGLADGPSGRLSGIVLAPVRVVTIVTSLGWAGTIGPVFAVFAGMNPPQGGQGDAAARLLGR